MHEIEELQLLFIFLGLQHTFKEKLAVQIFTGA